MEDLNNIETKIIRTQDENGEVHNFELVDVVEVDGNEYGLLVYVDEDETAETEKSEGCGCSNEECGCEEEEEIIIMKLNKSGESYSFETIEDDDEFSKVVEYLETECADDDEEDEEDAE
ncbi:MAG: DUF1292 domain-containing protein [bacterium]